MRGTHPEGALERIPADVLQKHQIKIVPISDRDRLRPRLEIRLLSVGRQGTIAQYRVGFNQVRIYVRLLNLSMSKEMGPSNRGSGGFGTIELKSVASREFVTKVQIRATVP